MLISDLLSIAIRTLQSANIDSPRFDASQLLAAELGSTLPGQLEKQMPADTAKHFLAQVSLRAAGYPLQYLLGEWEFYGHKIKVGEGVLIPRADTETLIDRLAALKLHPSYILDLCSGSGCIAVAAAKLFPAAKVDAVELHDKAFSYLMQNLALHKLSNATAHLCDALQFTPAGPVDVILSNPPYIPSAVIPTLQKEVQFEPKTALDGTADGLHFYREIAKRYYPFLKQGGWLLFEIGFDQANAVKEILQQHQYRNIQVYQDYGHQDRVIIAQK